MRTPPGSKHCPLPDRVLVLGDACIKSTASLISAAALPPLSYTEFPTGVSATRSAGRVVLEALGNRSRLAGRSRDVPHASTCPASTCPASTCHANTCPACRCTCHASTPRASTPHACTPRASTRRSSPPPPALAPSCARPFHQDTTARNVGTKLHAARA